MVDRLRVTELDFDTIKQNLKAFLKQQNEFTDYDFEGSGLSILLDILAYNTHYNAYYLNMVANESFLDTALLRDSVVSHAKTLGYTPYSTFASTAVIDFTVNATNNNLGTLTIPKGYSFLSNQVDGVSYNFVVLSDITATKANSAYYFENVEIKEGELISYRFVHDQSSNPKQIFNLPEKNIDTTTITVSISPSTTSTDIETYNRVIDILDITTTTKVFFLQENRNGTYDIYFGNNTAGVKIPDGCVVYVSYLVTNGPVANKANAFRAALPLVDSLGTSHTNFTVDVVSDASGGTERESIDSIKFNAAAQYTTQNRLVTIPDYESYLKKNYPAIDSVSVWGGDEEDPKIYGKVFISLKPKDGYFISETEKERILNEIVLSKSIVSVSAEIKDPKYLYILLSTNVRYDSRRTTLTEESLKNFIKNAILLYNNTNLNQFDSTLIVSRLQDAIDDADKSILGNEITLRIQKRFKPLLNQTASYTINFDVPLHRGTTTNKLTSTEFFVFDASNIQRDVILEEVPQSFTGISEIVVSNPGSGYTSAPTVTITGDGSGAEAIAQIVNGKIQSIEITKRGFDYSRAIVSITGGGGSGASATAIIDNRNGTLRTVYFDSNAERVIVDDNVGTINYETGRIQLNDLKILSIVGNTDEIRITVESEKGILQSVRNTIVSIDQTDPTSISIDLEKV